MKSIFEVLLLISLGILCTQDFKERAVSIWVLLVGFFLGASLHYLEKDIMTFLIGVCSNFIVIIIIFGILCLYARFKMKQGIFNAFGLGDLLFFFLLGVSLPTESFLIVFVFSLIFSLAVFLVLKKRLEVKTAPLAGLQSLFFGTVLVMNKVFNLSLY